MGNFETVIRATEDAENSQGATLEQNKVHMQSLEALTNKLKQQFEQLVLGTGQLENLAKDIIYITTAILKLTNAVGGLNTIFVALVGVLATIKANDIAKFFGNIPNLALKAKAGIVGYTQALKEAVAGEQALTAQSEIAGVALTNLQLIVGALTAVITVGMMAFNAYKQANEEMWDSYTSTAEKSAESAKTNADALKKYNEILSNEDASLGQLESALTSIDEKYKDQLDAIDDVNEKRKEAIRLLKEEAEGYNSNNAQEVYNENIKAYKEAQKELSKASYYSVGEPLTMTGGFGNENSKAEAKAFQAVQRAQGYEQEKQALENLIATYESFQQKQDINNSQYETYGIKISEAQNALTALDEKYADQLAVIQSTNEALARYGYVLTETSEGTLDLTYNTDEAGKILKESESNVLAEAQALMDLQDAYGITATQVQEYINLHPELKQEAEEAGESVEYLATVALAETYENAELATQSVADLATELASMQDKYNTLRDAVDEYNSTGTITSSTLKELLALGDEYTSLLTTENGKLILNEEGFINLADAMKQQMLQEVANETVTKMLGIAQDDLKGTTEDSGKAATNAADDYSNLVPVLTDVANKAISASAGMQSFMDVLARKGFNVEGLSKKAQDEMNQVYKEGVAKAELITAVQDKFDKNYESGSKKRSSSSKKSAKESKDAWLEAYKAEKDALDSLYKTNVITAEEYATKLRELSDKYLTDSADHQKKYAKEIHDAYEAMYTALKKSAKEALDEEEKRLKKQLDDLKDEAKLREKDLKRAHETEEKAIKKKIDTQKEYNKEVLKGIKSQIDALKREKDATKDSYDKRIDALKSEREEYDRQVKLMQLKEELAKAKATMQYVMDETGHFSYQEDSTAVDQAQENLIEEERKQQYERELSALEDARDSADEIYEQRIQSLEDYYDSVKEQQDEVINQMEKYLDEVKERHDQEEQALSDHYDALEAQYERNYNDFKENADKYLNGQMQLTNNENTEWGRRLTNLANFVNEYNRLMNSLNSGSTSNSSGYSGQGSSGGKIATTPKSSTKVSPKAKPDGVKYSKGSFSLADKAKIRASFGKHATGIASINSDEMALVGDSPNQELVIGSKLNGVPLSLSRGDGVVNAKSTNTLAGILNMIGGIAKPLAPNQTNNNSTSNITISNVSLPNVHNGEEFINCLQHFDIDMMQRSYDTY